MGFDVEEIIAMLGMAGIGKAIQVQLQGATHDDRGMKKVQLLALHPDGPINSKVITDNAQVGEYWPAMNGKMGFIWNGYVLVNVAFCEEFNWGAHLLFLQGPDRFVELLANKAQSLNMKLTPWGLEMGETRVAGLTEEGIFRELGLAYVEPKDRPNVFELIPLGNTYHKEFNILSSDGATAYKVYFSDGTWVCTHKWWKPGQECKHIKAAQEMMAHGN